MRVEAFRGSKTGNKVYVVSKTHDCSEAEQYGSLVYLTEGMLNPYAIGTLVSKMKGVLKHSKPDDWLLLNGLPTAQCIAMGILASMHGSVNLLMFRKGKYITRKAVFKK